MDDRTCARGRRRASRRRALSAVAVLVAIACACFAAVHAAPTHAAGTPTAGGVGAARQAALRGRSDAQLERLVTLQEAQATRIGEQLLAADRRRDEVAMERDAAKDVLGGFLADAYKQGGLGTSLMGDVFAAGSLQEAADRLRVAQVVADHHGSLLRELDQAEARLEVSRVERGQLIARLAASQAALVDIRAEQGRRALVRSEQAARRAEATAERQARRARRQAASRAALTPAAGTLVGAPVMLAGAQPSAAAIDAYLASKGSPMTGQGAAFVASGQRWRVDPRLLVAIAGAESNFGAVTCGPHNAWGWACPNDPADFGTWADGIDTVTEGLRRYYLDEGRTSVSLIQQKYCPVGAANDPTGLNVHWTTNVTKFLVEQGGNPAMVGPGPSTGAALVPDFGGLRVAVD